MQLGFSVRLAEIDRFECDDERRVLVHVTKLLRSGHKVDPASLRRGRPIAIVSFSSRATGFPFGSSRIALEVKLSFSEKENEILSFTTRGKTRLRDVRLFETLCRGQMLPVSKNGEWNIENEGTRKSKLLEVVVSVPRLLHAVVDWESKRKNNNNVSKTTSTWQ